MPLITQPSKGHNSQDLIRTYVARIEKLESEKSDLALDIREVYAEAKGNGLDVKVLRKVVARRKMDEAKRQEQDELLDLYEGVFA